MVRTFTGLTGKKLTTLVNTSRVFSMVGMGRMRAAILLSLFCALFSSASQAQTDDLVVSGTVISGDDGLELVGVSIVVEGETRGTVTDVNGKYSLRVGGNETLIFSFIGYETQRIPVNGRTTIDVTLAANASELDEVVVVGYGTQLKRDLTGSVSALREADFNKGGITSVDQMIAGRAPGVQVVQNTGEPGGGLSINIRGVGSITGGTSPLYVIDGLPIDNSVLISGTGNQVVANRSPRNPLSALNPNDIESIEVLKDASATAIYGSRGANGVILITTKSGSAGALKVTYDGSFGIQNVHRRLDLLTPQQYMDGVNDLISKGQGLPSEIVTGIQDGGTDWQDVVFAENAPIWINDLSFSWGNNTTSYLIALNVTSQDGVARGSTYDRYGARFNMRHQTEKFRLAFNSNMSYINDIFVPFGFDIAARGGVINAARVSDPTLPVRDADGNYVISPFMAVDNADAIITGTHMDGNRYRYFGSVSGEYFLTEALSLKLNVGGDVNNEDRTIYKDRTTMLGRDLNGIGTAYEGVQTNYLVEGTANYAKTLGDHRISAVAGMTTQRFLRKTSRMQGNNFITDATGAHNFSLADPATVQAFSGKSVNKLLSYLARVNYAFKDKYLLTATYRADGSSRFGSDNRFGYFPSVSVGWQVSQENFFQSLANTINMLKLRASWGRTGNQEIGNNQYLVTFASGTRTSYVLNDQFVNSLNPTRIANPDLRWETTEQYNIGIDFGLLNDRITGSFDWFYKDTYDMLIDLPVPTSSGFDTKLVNIGAMKNTGLEFSLTSHNITTPVFSWNSTINLGTLKNEVTDLGGIERITTGSMSQHTNIGLITPGLPIYSYYGYKVIGIWQESEATEANAYGAEPGDFRFQDINNDGALTSADRTDIGNSIPDFSWTFTNNLSYKALTLTFTFTGVEGVQMLNGNLLETYLPRGDHVRANRLAEPFLNRWTPENPTNEEPSFIGTRQFAESINTKTVSDASYIKLQSVRLTYDLGKDLFKGAVRSAQVYFSGQNLYTITDYNGFDPALNPNGEANFRIDWNGYPSATTLLIGINLGL